MNAEYGAIEDVVVTVGDRAFRRHDPRHRVHRHDDRPFQALGGVHGVECNGFFLGVGSTFDRARLIGPRGCDCLCEIA